MGHPAAPFVTGTAQASLAATPIGEPSSVDPHASIDPRAFISHDCTIRAGAHICAGVTLERGVYVGANVVFAESPETRDAGGTRVKAEAWIGANATICAGLTIGARAVVRPGAVVTRSVPPAAIVEGHPAAIVGYVGATDRVAAPVFVPTVPAQRPAVQGTPVKGVTVHYFPMIPDLRGNLTVGEFERQIPFTPERYFMVYDVPNREIRGEHAHHTCHEFLICVHGSCSIVADDGVDKIEVTLDTPDRGLYLPPMTWINLYNYSPDAKLLVFASHYYDNDDYVRDYGDWQALVHGKNAANIDAA